MLDCTERSLKRRITNLRTVFKEFLIESSTNGIKISYDDGSVGIGVVYHHFLKNLQLSPSWNTCSSARTFQ